MTSLLIFFLDEAAATRLYHKSCQAVHTGTVVQVDKPSVERRAPSPVRHTIQVVILSGAGTSRSEVPEEPFMERRAPSPVRHPIQVVILSGAGTSRSEVPAERRACPEQSRRDLCILLAPARTRQGILPVHWGSRNAAASQHASQDRIGLGRARLQP